MIYGNPLKTQECAQALLKSHTQSVLKNKAKNLGIVPWFWSRESIDATLQNQKFDRKTKYCVDYDNATNATVNVYFFWLHTLQFLVTRLFACLMSLPKKKHRKKKETRSDKTHKKKNKKINHCKFE